MIVIGANPTDGAPGVRVAHEAAPARWGGKLIVIDPRRIDLVRSPHVEAEFHLQLKPGTNVAVLNALAHVIVTEGLARRTTCARAASRRVREVEGVHRAAEELARSARGRGHRRAGGRSARRGAPVRQAPTAPSTTASASPSTARAAPR
jgi:predicted molibdopterin-dependent oxidoreductase YjgC